MAKIRWPPAAKGRRAGRPVRSPSKKPRAAHRLLLFRGRTPTRNEVAQMPYSLAQEIIVVDESNSFSDDGKGIRENLAIVCARIRRKEGYSELFRFIPNGGRMKYSQSDPDTRTAMMNEVSKLDITIVERHRYIDMNSLKTVDKKKAFYLGVLRSALEDALDLDDSTEVDVLIDNPPFPMDDLVIKMVSDFAKQSRRIRWFAVGISQANNYLKVHDYVTGTIADEIEGMKPEHYDVIAAHVRTK